MRGASLVGWVGELVFNPAGAKYVAVKCRGEVPSPILGNAYGFNGVRQYHIALLWSAGIGGAVLL